MSVTEASHGSTQQAVVSSTLSVTDWNAELVRGEVGQAVQRPKHGSGEGLWGSGEGLWVGGLTLPWRWQIWD